MATEEKKAVDLGLLEEDDEFEEFPAESKSQVLHSKINGEIGVIFYFAGFRPPPPYSPPHTPPRYPVCRYQNLSQG